MKIGLRIDVDTLRGTRLGVPSLLAAFRRHGISGTFFFCVGPDNMGRHLWRLLKPAFLWKMLRTRAASLYGWDILLRGTFWPGPRIGQRCAEIIRQTREEGHEVGLHAWDHQRWQARIDEMPDEELSRQVVIGYEALGAILAAPVPCSAAPSWKADARTLMAKARLPLQWNSDCRGTSVFKPSIQGQVLDQPQVPVTLPTYDELVGTQGVTPENYNEHLLTLLREDGLNVLTIHAEVEGISCREMFDEFVENAKTRGYTFSPLSELIADLDTLPVASIVKKEMPGREGWIAFQNSQGRES